MPDNVQVSHAYDALGRRTSVTALGDTTYYAHDAVGHILSAEAADMNLGTAYYEYRCLCQLIFGVFCPFFRSFISFS